MGNSSSPEFHLYVLLSFVVPLLLFSGHERSPSGQVVLLGLLFLALFFIVFVPMAFLKDISVFLVLFCFFLINFSCSYEKATDYSYMLVNFLHDMLCMWYLFCEGYAVVVFLVKFAATTTVGCFILII